MHESHGVLLPSRMRIPATRLLLAQGIAWLIYGIFVEFFGINTLVNDWGGVSVGMIALASLALVLFQALYIGSKDVNGALYLPRSRTDEWKLVHHYGYLVAFGIIVIAVLLRGFRLVGAWAAAALVMLAGVVMVGCGLLFLLRAADNFDKDPATSLASNWCAHAVELKVVEAEEAEETEESDKVEGVEEADKADKADEVDEVDEGEEVEGAEGAEGAEEAKKVDEGEEVEEAKKPVEPEKPEELEESDEPEE